MYIDAIIGYAYSIVRAFGDMWTILEQNVSYYVQRFLGWLPFGDAIYKFVDRFLSTISIDGKPIGAMGLIGIMVGFGLVFYVGYQFITWVLNSVT